MNATAAPPAKPNSFRARRAAQAGYQIGETSRGFFWALHTGRASIVSKGLHPTRAEATAAAVEDFESRR